MLGYSVRSLAFLSFLFAYNSFADCENDFRDTGSPYTLQERVTATLSPFKIQKVRRQTIILAPSVLRIVQL